MPLLDTQAYFAKLAHSETLTEEEVVTLLNELRHFRKATSYLASCQAATVEMLPKSASRTARSRHQRICATAAKLLDGDSSDLNHPIDIKDARDRCLQASCEAVSQKDPE